jgi:hypothetical protein
VAGARARAPCTERAGIAIAKKGREGAETPEEEATMPDSREAERAEGRIESRQQSKEGARERQ